MILRSLIKRGFFQLRTNLLRTLLTLLGVVFGVASVVAMMSIGEGAQREILATIEKMGADILHVQKGDIDMKNVGEFINDTVGLSRSDINAIEEAVPDLLSLGFRKNFEVKVTDLDVPVHAFSVLGMSDSMMRVHELRVAQGRPLKKLDHTYTHRAAVLGAPLAKRIFPDGALGKRLRLNYAFFEVVGVLAEREPGGDDLPVDTAVYNNAVLVPYSTALAELSPPETFNEVDLISVKMGSTEETLRAKRVLQPALLKLHGGVEDFKVISPEEILEQRKKAQSVFNLVLISIAAISLLVGGIGVMNIMLANIMERISEIGVRRAIGARRKDIRNQFLIEAVVICLIGGVIGLVVGLVISGLVAWLGSLPVAFAWKATVSAFLLSSFVGVGFGLMPAMRAANISPIEALQHE